MKRKNSNFKKDVRIDRIKAVIFIFVILPLIVLGFLSFMYAVVEETTIFESMGIVFRYIWDILQKIFGIKQW